MKKLIGRITAVPVRLLAELLEIVEIFDTVALRSVCWRLTRSTEDGNNLIVLLCRKRGIKYIQDIAESILVETGDSEVAATIGILEYIQGRNVEGISKWLNIAKTRGYKNQEQLLHLELMLSNFFEGYKSEAIADDILSRNDLPPHTTLYALTEKANFFLGKQEWERAEQIADRILSIQEQPDARITKWVICMKRGDNIQADKNFAMAKGKLPDGLFNSIAAQGWLFLGEVGKAMEWLYKSDYNVFYIKESKSPIGQLARSEEFLSFCREQGNK